LWRNLGYPYWTYSPKCVFIAVNVCRL
jgi:hypothetical protein